MKVVVLDAGTLDFAPEVWSGLGSEEIELELYDTTEPNQAVICQRIDGATAVFTNKVLLDRQTILSHPSLRFIGVLATGLQRHRCRRGERAGDYGLQCPQLRNSNHRSTCDRAYFRAL